MPLPRVLAQLKNLPKNQRIALGGGAAVATGAGLYSYRKHKTSSPTTSSVKPNDPLAQLGAPDLSQYGQVAVLVPIDWQDGANFGGAGGLTGPLTPGTPPGSTSRVPVGAEGNTLNDIATRVAQGTQQQYVDAHLTTQIAGRAGALAKYPRDVIAGAAGIPDNRIIPPGFGPPLAPHGPFTILPVKR